MGILDNAESLVDIETGKGTMAKELTEKGLSVTELDSSHEMLEEARKKSMDQKPGIEYLP